MANIRLDDIREAAEKKYGPYVIEGVPGGDVTLLNPIRLPKAKRVKLNKLQSMQESEMVKEQDQLLRDMIILIAATPEDAKRLLDVLGDDSALMAEVLNDYGLKSQAGNPLPSPS